MSEQIFVCKACHVEGRGLVQPVYEPHEDGTAVQRCPVCEAILMVYSDMGELDLGLLPEVEDNEFEIFGRPF